MKKFIDSVKALGEKMTGKEIEGTKLIDVIDETAENYQGGAGSGSEIVDALPATGVEGTTYLLRKKDETKVFKAQCYMQLYSKASGENNPLVMIDADIALLTKEITTKLNPDLSNGLVNFLLLNSFEDASKSSEEWQTFITSNKVAIVKTEEEVLNLTEDVDYIFQDLGVIGVENFIFLEVIGKYISSGTINRLAEITPYLISYSMCLVKQGDMVFVKVREVVYNSEATSSQPKYSFTEWVDDFRKPLVGTLTDTYVSDQETLMSLEDGDWYLINLTPTQEVSYSYTQYVFDKGVYTPLGGGNSARYFVTVYGNTNMAGNYPGQVTIEVDTPNINTVDDLFDWLKAKGFVTTISPGSSASPMAVYPNAIGMDDNEVRLVAGCVLYEEGDNRTIYFPKADIAIYGYRSNGYTLTYVNPEK